MQLINTNHFTVLNTNLSNIIDFNLYQSQLNGETIGCVLTHGESILHLQYSKMLNQAENYGATVENITAAITTQLLSAYSIIVIGDGGSSWSSSELTALYNWVRGGRAIYILGDNKDASQVSVSNKFSVFYGDAPGLTFPNIDYNSPIMYDVTALAWVPPSSSINLSSSTDELSNVMWKDGKGLICLLQEGKGRLLWNVIGEGMVGDSMINTDHNRYVSKNSWIWLANKQKPEFPIHLLIIILALNPSLINTQGGLSLTFVLLIVAFVLALFLIFSYLIIYLKNK